jgi:multidrug efflux pump subunit AcrA (membrane-fusion protein)
MYARVTVNMGNEKHIVVPDISIVKQQGSGDRYVYVYADGKVEYVKVTLGRRLDASYEVLSGLQEGDKVAITSLTKLNNGTEVTVIE